jgi:DNA primase
MNQENFKEMSTLINICHANLKNSEKCLSYLNGRGISTESIDKYKLGFFPQNTSMLTKYVSSDFLQRTMITNISGYSDFSNRYYLIFPIQNEYKEPVAIIGRTLLDETQRSLLGLSKYKNSSYKKSKALYGLEFARPHILRKKHVFVVEGNFDVITMDANGVSNSVAICGAAFSKTHFHKLARYTDKIIFILDSDDGGRLSMERIYKKFANRGVKLRFYNLPDGVKDVDEYFNGNGGTMESFFKDIKRFIPNW